MLFKLHSKFKPAGDQPEAIDKLVAGIKKGDRYQTLKGVTGSGKTFTMANVIANFDMPVLVMAPNKTLAGQLYREYKNFFPENSVNYFVSYYDYYQPEAYIPTSDTYIDKEAMINEEIDRLRHEATSALSTRRDVIVVASVSCIYNLGVPEMYLEFSLRLWVGQPITRGDLMRQLVKIQFERTSGALSRGKFRVRGDDFEIMPATGEVVYRINVEGQKINELTLTDPLTRLVIAREERPKQSPGIKDVLSSRGLLRFARNDKLTEIIIFPIKHFVSTQPQIERAIKDIKSELKERLAYFKKHKLYLEEQRLERRTRYDLEMLKTLGYCHGVENYSRHLIGKLAGEPPETLLAYFPKKEFLTIIDESHIGLPQVRGMYAGDKSRKETLVQYGWRLPSALDNRPLKFSEFEERIGQVICTTATPGPFELNNSDQIIEQIIRPTGLVDPPIEVRAVYPSPDPSPKRGGSVRYGGQVEDLMREIQVITKNNERAIANVLTKKMAEDLSEHLLKKGFKVNYLHSGIKTMERMEVLNDFRSGKFNVLIGVNLLREGLDFPEVTFVAILDADREGFLRSDASLIQTMGRTARNVKGKVILYADTVTGSMRRAIDEVNARRKKQLAYNRKHGIVAKSVERDIGY